MTFYTRQVLESEKMYFLREAVGYAIGTPVNNIGLSAANISDFAITQMDEIAMLREALKGAEVVVSVAREKFENKSIRDRDIYDAAIRTFGMRSQLVMAIEEMAELQQALTKALRGKEDNENINEEIADVEIMIEQLKIIFDRVKVGEYKTAKLDRIKTLLEFTKKYFNGA